MSQKNVPSSTGYSFNTHPPIFAIFGTSSEEIQKLAAERERCVNMVFSADDKVLIKSLYQFSGGLVQTFN